MNALPIIQLSCRQCQQRKTKCDKLIPCSACQKAGFVCDSVQRQRLPRGRSGNQRLGRHALRDRVARLEAVVLKAQQDSAATGLRSMHINTYARGQQPRTASTGSPLDAQVSTPVASEFWAELSDVMDGLRNVLDEQDGDVGELGGAGQGQLPVPTSLESREMSSHCLVLGNHAGVDRMQPAVSSDEKAYMLRTFHERVDPIVKVLHWPTVFAELRPDSREQNTGALSAETQALGCAIHFAAICALQDHEINDRQLLVARYQQQVEAALARANLLTTREIVVLQAFVIYLSVLRACQADAQQWTLVATAIRVATAQGLASLPADSPPTFETEQKRRLWCFIGLLDMQAAMDRGTRPILKHTEFAGYPLNVNDTQLDPRNSSRPPHQADVSEFTDMTVSLVSYHASACQRAITDVGFSASLSHQRVNPQAIWNEQLDILVRYEKFVKDLSAQCTSESPRLHRLAVQIAQQSAVTIRLGLYRPLYKRSGGMQPVPDDYDVLGNATEVLEREARKRNPNDFSQWSWHTWVKWYALAVVLAELCGRENGPDIERAWKAAQISFDDYSKIVADSGSGLLWKPIAKLMRRARVVQEGLPRKTNGTSTNGAGFSQHTTTAMPVTPGVLLDSGMTLVDFAPGGAQRAIPDDNHVDPETNTDRTAEAMSWFYWDSLINDLSDQVSFEV